MMTQSKIAKILMSNAKAAIARRGNFGSVTVALDAYWRHALDAIPASVWLGNPALFVAYRQYARVEARRYGVELGLTY